MFERRKTYEYNTTFFRFYDERVNREKANKENQIWSRQKKNYRSDTITVAHLYLSSQALALVVFASFEHFYEPPEVFK